METFHSFNAAESEISEFSPTLVQRLLIYTQNDDSLISLSWVLCLKGNFTDLWLASIGSNSSISPKQKIWSSQSQLLYSTASASTWDLQQPTKLCWLRHLTSDISNPPFTPTCKSLWIKPSCKWLNRNVVWKIHLLSLYLILVLSERCFFSSDVVIWWLRLWRL